MKRLVTPVLAGLLLIAAAVAGSVLPVRPVDAPALVAETPPTSVLCAPAPGAQVAVAGPKARKTLRGVVDTAHDLSNEALPYLAARAVTVGGGIPGCMHGGGSPDGAKMVVKALTKWEDYFEMAKKIMDIPTDAVKEPEAPVKK